MGDADLERAQVRVGGRAARRALDGGERLESRARRAARLRAGVPCGARRSSSSTWPARAERCSRSIARPARSSAASDSSTTSLDSRTYVTSPITIDANGNLYYNVLRWRRTNPWTTDISDAWLVKIAPDGTAIARGYSRSCRMHPRRPTSAPAEFPSSALPVAAVAERGAGVAAVRIAARGHQPRAGGRRGRHGLHRLARASEHPVGMARRGESRPHAEVVVVAAQPLPRRLQRAAPAERAPGGCRAGATTGVDPADNQPGSGGVNDNSTRPRWLLRTARSITARTRRYNYSQGHMMRSRRRAQFLERLSVRLGRHAGDLAARRHVLARSRRRTATSVPARIAASRVRRRVPRTRRATTSRS